MNEKKIKCFFCKNLATTSITLGNSKTIVCDECEKRQDNNTWIFSDTVKRVESKAFRGKIRKN